MLTVTPFLWFEAQAEEAMLFYTSIFPRGKVGSVKRIGGNVLGVEFELEGQKVHALNGRPKELAFNDSVSFFVGCETQDEIDTLWTKLLDNGGKPVQCGWLKDRYGLAWQIVPNSLGRLLDGNGDSAKAKRVMDALLGMKKLDIAALENA
jgi:predicted 3-demethylubiquinone-9 3-methyltransferase (glyoxalase superfamily)